MSPKFDGLLDQDHSAEAEKLDLKEKFGLNIPASLPTWQPKVGGRWSYESMRPEFLALRHNIQKKPLRRTAWLDGLRGFAAFIVCIHHNQLWAHGFDGNRIFETGFGFEGRHYFAQLPFIRLLFTGGHFAVAIFFVISGYVLSVKSLGLIHKGQYLAAADSIGSALFRRWLRLYIPVIGVTLLWLTFRHFFGFWVNYGEDKGTYGENLLNWYYSFKNYSFVFLEGNGWDFAQQYHLHAWTIPFEMKGSIIVFTVVSALSRATRNARIWCTLGLIWYFMYVVDGWYGAAFCAGMLLCDLDLLAINDNLPNWMKKLEPFKELIFFHLFIIGLYLGGCPSLDGDKNKLILRETPGWKWLSYLRPQAVYDQKWFYLFWAATMTVAAIPRLGWLKSFFETRFCQYLARISFALYLVHGLVMLLLGDRLYVAVGLRDDPLFAKVHQENIPGWVNKFPISKAGPFGLELAFWLPQLIILPVTLYCSEIVTRMFDEPSVKIANGLFKRTMEAPPSTTN